MKKLRLYFCIFLLLMGVSLPFYSRVETVDAETLEVNACGGEYYSFIATVRSENTRRQTLNDLFTLPYCQLNDILELEEELDELKDAFQSASNNCANTSEYKKGFHKILMEQYFVRNVQKGKSDVIHAKDAEEYEELKEALLERLEEEMFRIFVIDEDRVSENTFDEYFANWSAEYEDRIGDYNACEEGPWAELTDTWNDFLETLSELSIDIKEPESHSFKEIVTPQTDVDADKDMSAFGKSVINAYEYLKNAGNKEKAEIEAPATIADLSTEGGSSTRMSYDILETLGMGQTLYDIEIKTADRMAKYELLYGSGGAVAATDMQGILAELNRILTENNAKDFPNITAAAAKIYDKQCN